MLLRCAAAADTRSRGGQLNEKGFSAMINAHNFVLNTVEHSMYAPHTMHGSIFLTVDLMAAPAVPLEHVRSALHRGRACALTSSRIGAGGPPAGRVLAGKHPSQCGQLLGYMAA